MADPRTRKTGEKQEIYMTAFGAVEVILFLTIFTANGSTAFLHPVDLLLIITARQRSCGKDMFSVVSVCLSVCQLVILSVCLYAEVPIQEPPAPLPPTLICSNLFSLDITIQGPHPPRHGLDFCISRRLIVFRIAFIMLKRPHKRPSKSQYN